MLQSAVFTDAAVVWCSVTVSVRQYSLQCAACSLVTDVLPTPCVDSELPGGEAGEDAVGEPEPGPGRGGGEREGERGEHPGLHPCATVC